MVSPSPIRVMLMKYSSARRIGCERTTRSPSRHSRLSRCQAEVAACSSDSVRTGRKDGPRIRAIMTAENRNEAASASTTASRPPTANNTPPIAGPIRRDRCCETPISELA